MRSPGVHQTRFEFRPMRERRRTAPRTGFGRTSSTRAGAEATDVGCRSDRRRTNVLSLSRAAAGSARARGPQPTAAAQETEVYDKPAQRLSSSSASSSFFEERIYV